jgi:alkanesulfonate monooxygenase SsuD/methylene tetrahydromethanopterin reductase-like flavin-dependent oxidoreductase (luciferase family)
MGAFLRVGPPRLRAGRASGASWVILSAVAASTSRLKPGLAVTLLARRRPQVVANAGANAVANAVASIDLLSSLAAEV